MHGSPGKQTVPREWQEMLINDIICT